jgi:hypothetical protein
LSYIILKQRNKRFAISIASVHIFEGICYAV